MKNLIQIFNETLDSSDSKPSTEIPKEFNKFKIKPSMLGSKCLRKIYYSSAYVPEDFGFDLDGKKRMKLGDCVHHMLHEVFKKSGIVIEYYNPDGSVNMDWKNPTVEDREFPLECPELYIKKGKIDAVMIIDGDLWIGEYKSINMKGFSNLTSPKSDHLTQAITYWYVFNKLLSEGKFSHIKELQGFSKAKGVRWLYVNKDDTELKEYIMTDGDSLFSQIVEKIVKIKEMYDSKTLPPKTEDWCKSCNWRLKCKQNFNIT